VAVAIVQAKWFEKLPPLRFSACWAIFSAALAVFWLPVAGIAFALHGSQALVAATVAAGVCWVGASLALIATARFGREGINAPLFTLIFGLVFNGALPFAIGLTLNRAGGPLSDGGAFGLTIVFLQFALIVETLLSLCLLKSPR
jgi:hypothetical protein